MIEIELKALWILCAVALVAKGVRPFQGSQADEVVKAYLERSTYGFKRWVE